MALSRMQRRVFHHHGFTLVELMVTITTIAILMSLAMPSMRSSRNSAKSLLCQSNLRGVQQLFDVGAGHARGVFPNAGISYKDNSSFRFHDFLSSTFSPQGLCSNWPKALGEAGVIESFSDVGPLSCPELLSQLRTERGSRTPHGDEPGTSYLYSIAFFTEAEAWRTENSTAREALSSHTKDVRVEDVLFPSAKVFMSELCDYHGDNSRLGTKSAKATQRCNAVFADGHAARVEPLKATTALPLHWQWFLGDTLLRSVPFNAPADGFRGRDF